MRKAPIKGPFLLLLIEHQQCIKLFVTHHLRVPFLPDLAAFPMAAMAAMLSANVANVRKVRTPGLELAGGFLVHIASFASSITDRAPAAKLGGLLASDRSRFWMTDLMTNRSLSVIRLELNMLIANCFPCP
jgi:hypothetical protein